MFLQVSVILFTGGVCLVPGGFGPGEVPAPGGCLLWGVWSQGVCSLGGARSREVCSQGVSAPRGCLLPGECLVWGVWSQGVSAPRGSAWSGGSRPRGSAPGGVPGGDPYWNAFLFTHNFISEPVVRNNVTLSMYNV